MARILKVVGRGVEGRWLVVPPESAYAGSRAGDFADFLATRARYALSRCLPLHTASDFCGNGDLIGGFTTRV